MKLYYTYLVYILSAAFLQANPQTVVNNNITLNTNQNSENNNKLDNKSLQTNEQMQAALQKTFNDAQEMYKNATTSIIDYIKNNKIKCSCITLASFYAYISYQIYTKQQVVDNPSAWSNWYNNYSIEELFAIPGEKLGGELLHEIQSRYADPENPTNFIYSLVQFSKILQAEIDALEDQKTIYTWIQRMHCNQIFFIDNNAITEIQTKIHKVLFLKHIFTTWYATYKIERNS